MRSVVLTLGVISALLGCGAREARPNIPMQHREAQPSRNPDLPSHEVVTERGARQIGRERYRDDGDQLSSVVEFMGTRHELVLSRSSRSVRCDETELTLDADTIALENGNWQAYSVAASRFANAARSTPVQIVLPCAGVKADGMISVVPEGSGRRVEVSIGRLSITVLLDAHGAFVSGRVPQQGVTARVSPPPPQVAARGPATEADVIERDVSVQSHGVTLRGTEMTPRRAPLGVPVALIVAGSGPTDRDGNAINGMRSDAYRQLAAALVAAGVASVRYDKRGVGASGKNFSATSLNLQDFVGDALAWIEYLRKSSRFGPLTLIGHSEGGLVCILAAQQASPDALVLLNAAGRPLDAVLKEQLRRQVSAGVLGEYDRIIAALRGGQEPGPIPQELATLFAPPARSFIAGQLGLDPGEELARVQNARITIIAGETDLQLSLEDAQTLARHRPDATLNLVPQMNHVLKWELHRESPQASYVDPSRPLAPGLREVVLAAIAR